MKNSFFFGKQDLEDSINSTIWRNVVLELSDGRLDVSVDEIEQIKGQIPYAIADEKLNQNQKFYHKLRHLVDMKADELSLGIRHILPTKGSESGKLLCKHITDINQVEGLDTAFQHLQTLC